MLRALVSFLVLPGVVAGLLPWMLMLLPRLGSFQSDWFWIPGVLGVLILVQSVVSFYRRGHGTLAPWDPPKRLVIEDLYRYNRNPMYVGVIFIVFAWAGLLGSTVHYMYAVVLPLVFHVRVLMYEEPEMERLFPDDWSDYKANVPRWHCRMSPYNACRSAGE